MEMKKLSKEEMDQVVNRRRPSPRASERRQMIEEFKAFLSQLSPGEGGEITLSEEDLRRRQTIKNRLKKAASELGLTLEFFRRRRRIVFRVVGKETSSAEG